MKVFKDNNLSLILKPWGYGEKIYLHCGVIAGFHLVDDGRLFSEQEIWQQIPPLLGDTPLDVGMPKIRGEVIVTGSAYAPHGEPVAAMEAGFVVGGLQKKILVFGDRYFIKKTGGGHEISRPKPFLKMPIDYSRAFGGPDYPLNPEGKGKQPEEQFDGTSMLPLPNLEYENHLVTRPSDTPPPASLSPVPLTCPQRYKKTGTYDDRWKRERWPYFPEDMDYSFFNVTPEDQQIKDFFQGTENYLLYGLHPEFPQIQGRLPGIRPKLFVYKQKKLGKDFSETNLEFREVKLKPDTIWFFPDLLLGIVIYHGSVRILDDEYADLHRVYLTYHSNDEPDLTLEEYFEQMKKWGPLGVEIDMAPFQEAAANGEKMLIEYKRVGKKIDDIKNSIMGKSPAMVYTPEQTGRKLQKVIDNSKKLLNDLEKQAREMHLQYGHLVEIDFSIFDHWRKTIPQMEKNLKEMLQKADDLKKQARDRLKQAREKAAQNLSRASARAQQNFDEKLAELDKLEELDFDSYSWLEGDEWQKQGMKFVSRARFYLEDNDFLDLKDLGFSEDTIARAWLGVNAQSSVMQMAEWGLEEDEEQEVIVPAGLVLPLFDEATLTRIKIITERKEKKFFLVPGSKDRPVLMLPCDEENYPVVWIEDELEGLYLEQETGDFAAILCNCTLEEMDNETKEVLKNTFQILLLVPESKASDELLVSWQKEFENVRLLSLPDAGDIFEYREKGGNIRAYILSHLPEEFARKHDVSIAIPEPDGSAFDLKINFPAIDLKQKIDDALKECFDFFEKKKQELLKQAGQRLQDARGVFEKKMQGKYDVKWPEIDLNKPGPARAKMPTPMEVAQQAIENLEKQKMVQGSNAQAVQKIDEAIARIREKSADMQKEYDKLMHLKASLYSQFGLKEGEPIKADISNLPPEALKEFEKFGMDVTKMRPITREEVIELYQKGESLNFYDLSELDLSGLDLSGADFTMARCEKTNFSGAVLRNVKFYKNTSLQEADFSDADLTEAQFEFLVLQKAKFAGSILKQCRFKQTVCQECDFTSADLGMASMELSVMQNCVLDKADYKQCKMNLSVIQKSVLQEADFTLAHLEKSVLQECRLDKTVFAEARLEGVNFIQCQGRDVVFHNAELLKTGFNTRNEFEQTGFDRARLTYVYAKESNFACSCFQGAKIKQSTFQECDLRQSNLEGVFAPGTAFLRCDLESALMKRIHLLSGSLKKSRLVEADLRGANLYGVDFYKAVLGKTKMQGANLGLTVFEFENLDS